MILSVASLLDNEKCVGDLREVLNRTKGTAKDGKIWMQEVYEAAGTDTRTFLLFKMIHQGIIMSLASQIKVIMFATTKSFTKDVRTPDGWIVSVKVREKTIRVSHTRKEVSMLSGPLHFEFEWKISINLDFDLSHVINVSIQTKNFTPDSNMEKEQSEKLSVILQSMNLHHDIS